jgi:hypothetical protein
MMRAVAFGMAARDAAAQSSVTFYGILDAGVTWASDAGGTRQVKFDDGISCSNRFGLKSDEDLGRRPARYLHAGDRHQARKREFLWRHLSTGTTGHPPGEPRRHDPGASYHIRRFPSVRDTHCVRVRSALHRTSVLSDIEVHWLNEYHAHVHNTLADMFSGATSDWLIRHTQSI